MLKIVRQATKIRCFTAAPTFRAFSGKAPESFFDEGEELEKELWDFKLAKATGGIKNLTTGHAGQARDTLGKEFTLDDLQAKVDLGIEDTDEAESMDDDAAEEYEEKYGTPAPGHLPDHANIASRSSDMSISSYVPVEYSNHAMDWNDLDREDEEPEELQSFTRRTDERSMPIDKQGLVACPGKRQRRGTQPVLKCHLIDLDALHYTDVVTLRRFLSADSEMLGKRLTGLCSKCQRNVARTVRRSRNLGLLSHLGAFRVVDADPQHDADKFNFHRSPHDIPAKISKTII